MIPLKFKFVRKYKGSDGIDLMDAICQYWVDDFSCHKQSKLICNRKAENHDVRSKETYGHHQQTME